MRYRSLAALLFAFAFISLASSAMASVVDIENDPMFAIREGWAWPVVVVPPPSGWETPEGEAVKYAMRIAERQVSRQRGAIRGKEVVFLYSTADNASDVQARLRQWRDLGVCAIISFAGGEIDDTLSRMCRDAGPSVVFVGGENIRTMPNGSNVPFPFIFALDYSYFARTNAIAEAISVLSKPDEKVAVVSDLMSAKLAHGADLTVKFARSRGLSTMDIAVPAFRQDHFVSQVYDLEAGGVRSFSIWLDAMATLSIWRTARVNGKGSTIYYCGQQHPILLDAEGLVIVDKDEHLYRNTDGVRAMIELMRDEFSRTPSDPVLASKAYALAKWVIAAYSSVSSIEVDVIARALENVKDIPLLDELITIDPNTHRPVNRKYGVLMVGDREYKSHGVVDVFGSEVEEEF